MAQLTASIAVACLLIVTVLVLLIALLILVFVCFLYGFSYFNAFKQLTEVNEPISPDQGNAAQEVINPEEEGADDVIGGYESQETELDREMRERGLTL
jgi:hypothetical protein